MQPAFSETGFVLKRYGRVAAGRYRLHSVGHDEPLLFIEERADDLSPLSTAHVYEDEEESSGIEQAVVDAETGKKVGSIGLAVDEAGDFVSDTWVICDAAGKPVGKALRQVSDRFVARVTPDSEPPQEMDIACGAVLVGRLRERTNVVGYQLAVDFSMDVARLLDRRLGRSHL
jgi:hypothetical protein